MTAGGESFGLGRGGIKGVFGVLDISLGGYGMADVGEKTLMR